YESPAMSGFKVYGQYSNSTGLSTDYAEGNDGLPSSQRDRYAAVGSTYRSGPLRLAVAVDCYMFNDVLGEGKTGDGHKRKNAVNYSIAGNYDFGDFKIYGGYQYAQNMRTNVMGANAQQGDGHAVMVGLSAEVGGGTAMFSAAYAQADKFNYWAHRSGKADDYYTKELKSAWQVAAGYKYPFSKRTMLYGAVTYRDTDLEASRLRDGTSTDQSQQVKTSTAMVGLQHKF
ncbi:MAG: porin, partial [Sutterella sp.]